MASIGTRRALATVVSAVAAAGILAVAAWMLMGNDGGPDADAEVQIIPPAHASAEVLPGPTAEAAQAPDAGGVPPLAGGVPPLQEIAVYITGEVVNPGVYTVPTGRRLTDVVQLAGGPTRDADLDRVNLAAYVADAGHYRIPAAGDAIDTEVGAVSDTVLAAASEPAGIPTVSTPACGVPIDINTATAECLETLPGIGGVRAQSIVSHREQAGPFVSADAITDVSGIGNGIYGRIATMITVDSR